MPKRPPSKPDPSLRAIYQEVRNQWGAGWTLLGDALKRAVLAQKALYRFSGLDESATITPASIQAYYEALLDYAGLEQSDIQG